MTVQLYMLCSTSYGVSIFFSSFGQCLHHYFHLLPPASFHAFPLALIIFSLNSLFIRYLVFIHLENFSLFNNPSMASSRETIKMLCECFPERLGKDTTILYSTLLYSTVLYCSRYSLPCHISHLSYRITSIAVATHDTLSRHIFHVNHTTHTHAHRSLSVLSASMGVQNRV